VGKGCSKKRMRLCNVVDRGIIALTLKSADLEQMLSIYYIYIEKYNYMIGAVDYMVIQKSLSAAIGL
jgi:hypothetical protein